MGGGEFPFSSTFPSHSEGRGCFQDLDGGLIGQTVSETFIGSSGPVTQMTWMTPPSGMNLTTPEQFERALVDEKIWGIITST
jgi:hypothetical protein